MTPLLGPLCRTGMVAAPCALLAGCGSELLLPWGDRPTFLRASVTGAVESEIDAEARFYSVPQGSRLTSEPGWPRSGQGIFLDFYGAPRPARGVHVLSPTADFATRTSGTGALFARVREDGMWEAYMAVSGHIRITRSTRRILEGSFVLTALHYCVMEPFGEECDPAALQTVPPDTPSLTARGTFSAVPGSPNRPD